ncbi:MAG: hypothetical protein A3J55_04215 [Candidatus Ryanbacteria bacterium RIFCSPHIGHO2_02_FULL_45_17b]|uniref:Uncharacterized protein n=1 Tax=Candidatus Ryanbacteria bacterium RIFCSPHIGHO2_01_FULL_45_22 TaxID=1802114 RepID=A0A1G2G1K0_9BACT|nr:MAG: hypothetical protein A2719_02350 [Candidatus Ryanbacteria bacterium RIFCSPHIGHO2_01_FULL_45_22]OGZ46477.1 MAG: hypothetical protein A3J55_04215 [Candidatus Ryanbacteria bacterium RIFCSPHIGHO2_02_FULL_45_17b]
MQLIFIISGTALGWAGLLGALYLFRVFPRVASVPFYYLLHIIFFVILSVVLRRAGVTYSAGVFAIVVTGILLILGLFYWVFINPSAAARYITVIDWLIPSLFVFVSVYVVTRLVR